MPNDNYMVSVLELLRTVGVPLKDVEVYDYANHPQVSGDQFLTERGNWDNILKRQPVKSQGSTAPAGKLKKRYRCNTCGKIYEATYAVTFCQDCRGSCVAA